MCTLPTEPLALRILIVDDHLDSVSLLARLLTMQGHTVETAGTAASALAAASRTKCDMIISDLGLPDRSGLELMQEVRRQYGMPGIAISGHTGESVVAESIAAGFATHLSKPVVFESLLKAVEEVYSTHLANGGK